MASLAFDLADKYRCPALILSDGMLGQMMEAVEFQEPVSAEEMERQDKLHWDWCMHANQDEPNRHHHEINSLELDPQVLEQHVLRLNDKYLKIEAAEKRWEEYNIQPDNEILCVAFGTASRIVKSAIDDLREEGINIGLLRPITLWPFPGEAIVNAITPKTKLVYTFEFNLGQMVEDVRLAINGRVPVEFYGKVGGVVFTPDEIKAQLLRALKA